MSNCIYFTILEFVTNNSFNAIIVITADAKTFSKSELKFLTDNSDVNKFLGLRKIFDINRNNSTPHVFFRIYAYLVPKDCNRFRTLEMIVH